MTDSRPTGLTPDAEAAIRDMDDEQLLAGCPYPAGSDSKILVLALRHERFAKKSYKDHNTHMTDILWNSADSPLCIPLRTAASQQTLTERITITTHHAQD